MKAHRKVARAVVKAYQPRAVKIGAVQKTVIAKRIKTRKKP
jgi:hypothetical protein